MKKYENLDNFNCRTHIVEVTFQQGEYKETIKYQMGGNTFGYCILTSLDPEDIYEDELLENEAQLKINEDKWFRMILKNENGEESIVEDELRYLKNLVVKIEIVDCVIR